MWTDDRLAGRIRAILGSEPVKIADLRARLVAAGDDLGDPDVHGLDRLDRVLQLEPDLFVLDDPADRRPGAGRSSQAQVVSVAAALDGVSFLAEVDDDWAAHDRLADVEAVAPLVWVVLGASLRRRPLQVVGPDGQRLGPIETVEHPVERGTTDALAGPPGWLEPFAGGCVTLTLRSGSPASAASGEEVPGAGMEVHLAPVDGAVPEPTDAQCGAARAAFDRIADTMTISTFADDAEVRITNGERLMITMAVLHPEAVHGMPVPPASTIAVRAGLEVRDGTIGAPGTDWDEYGSWRSRRRMEWLHDLDDDQAMRVQLLVGCALEVDERGQDGFGADDDERIGAIALMASILDDAAVAERAWAEWSERGAVPDRIAEFVDTLTEVADGASDEEGFAGVVWLRARYALATGNAVEAERRLRAAVEAGCVHRGVLVELAGIEADRSDARAARRLLDAADAGGDGVHDPDDRFRWDTARRIAREIEPMLRRPPPRVGRNERCPCGSGRKYKQCHLGRESWPLDVRAGWVYAKAVRFLAELGSDAVWSVAAELAGPSAPSEDVDDIADSNVPVDLLLAEGGVFAAFVARRGGFLPDDERALAATWQAAERAVFTVGVSNGERLELLPLDGGPALLVEATLTRDPLPVGIHVVTRPLPVPDGTYRLDGGILPVSVDLVDELSDALASGDLADATDALRLVLA